MRRKCPSHLLLTWPPSHLNLYTPDVSSEPGTAARRQAFTLQSWNNVPLTSRQPSSRRSRHGISQQHTHAMPLRFHPKKLMESSPARARALARSPARPLASSCSQAGAPAPRPKCSQHARDLRLACSQPGSPHRRWKPQAAKPGTAGWDKSIALAKLKRLLGAHGMLNSRILGQRRPWPPSGLRLHPSCSRQPK